MSQNKREQLLAVLQNYKQQGKESATFNIDFLIDAYQEPIQIVKQPEEKREDTGMYNPRAGDMDGGQF
tara:strand:- start:1159 stop:1362 length:204 start_codon:yes stop_codon:yes gene_type:complete